LVHWNKIICPRLTVWTSHRINLSLRHRAQRGVSQRLSD
jgi:hypothetical protein